MAKPGAVRRRLGRGLRKWLGWSEAAVEAQAVAGPADGLDQRLAQLSAQVADVDVDEVRARIEVHVPGHGQPLLPGHNLARVADERLQEREFPGGQAERPATDRRL